MDRLSALFGFVVGLVVLPVSIFSGSYMVKYLEHRSLRYFCVLYFGFFAALILVLIASDVISLVLAWEVMSVFSYLLVNYDDQTDETTKAGFLMLAMSEAGTVAIVIAVAILANSSGRLDFDGIRAAVPHLEGGVGFAVFLLAFLGFGVKAGLVPLNSWLPRAHPVAPTNVSALLSGVMVNLGIYGILRIDLDLLPPADLGRGLLVLAFGSVSALVGILYATIQTDLKRMLAHSTIENMGIVTAAIGAGMVFAAAGFSVLAGVALITALYHMANHSLYKTLLFLGSGAVETGAGSRDLDRLGGLARRMPWTSVLFLAGAWSIAGLPPFNGFVSEWLTLQTILRSAVLSSAVVKIVFALAGAALALTAGLAVTCFVKAFAMGFLGIARSHHAEDAHEVRPVLRVPMIFLAVCCFLLGVLPAYTIPALDRASAPIARASATDALVPPFFRVPTTGGDGLYAAFVGEFHDLGAQVGREILPGRGLVVLHRGGEKNPVVFAMSTTYMVAALIVLLALAYLAFRLVTRARSVARRPAWDGGLRRLRPQLTYTATGFSNPVSVVFHALLRPTVVEDTTEAVAEHFRTAVRREYSEVHVVDRLMTRPIIAVTRWLAQTLRTMHVGHVNAYAAYILVAVLAALVVGQGGEILSRLMTDLGTSLH
jgi:hydrogenase-4 component B